jgi:hypothetical protein
VFDDGNECCNSSSGLMKLINYAETEVKKKRLYIVGVYNQSIFHILAETQISTIYRYIENTCILAILQISNGYHKTFQIVDYTMTNIQKISLSKIIDSVPDGEIWRG